MHKRNITLTKIPASQAEQLDFISTSPEQRLSELWPLTLSVWSMVPGAEHAESRLQRHVTVLTRPRG